MDTLHKKLSEIRDLRAEELDLVGGAGEGWDGYIPPPPSYWTQIFNTSSLKPGEGGVPTYQTDDATTQTLKVD